jgi:GntR family transcriptional regulator
MIPFSVTFKSGVPIYEQVIYAVKKAIVSGLLQEGDPFPSVRQMSKELRINPNTAQKIVTRLVQENLIEIKSGVGSVVSKLGNATQEQRHTILNTEVEKLVVEARRLSIKKGELLEAIGNHWTMDK